MQLTAQLRDKFGKHTKALRREGFIPAELYGHEIGNLHLAVPAKEFKRVFREAGESTVLTLEIPTEKGSEKRPVMIYDIARDSLRGEFLNIDFYQVRMDEKIQVKVPLHFTGAAPAVKEKGGIVLKSLHEVEVEALPGKLPHAFEVPLERLTDIGKTLFVRDLAAPEGVRILLSPETAIATVTEKPKAEEEVKPAAEVKVEEIKTEAEAKKEERAKKEKAETAEPQAAAKPASEKK